MGVVFLNDHGCIRCGDTRFWAERGLIHWERASDGAYGSFAVRSALQRLNGFSDMLGNSRKDTRDKLGDDWYEKIQRLIEDMIPMCQRAREQGMPSDPQARRDLKDRRPKTFVVPGINSLM